MTEQPDRAARLSSSQRLRVAWAIAWPCALFGLIYYVPGGKLGLSNLQVGLIGSAIGIFHLLVFAP